MSGPNFYNPNPKRMPNKPGNPNVSKTLNGIAALIRWVYGAFLFFYGFYKRDWTMIGVGWLLMVMADY